MNKVKAMLNPWPFLIFLVAVTTVAFINNQRTVRSSIAPQIFIDDVAAAQQLSDDLKIDLSQIDSYVGYAAVSGVYKRNSGQSEVECSYGTLQQNGETRKTLRCGKSYSRVFEISEMSKEVVNSIDMSVIEQGWKKTSTDDYYSEKIIITKNGNLSYQQEGVELTLNFSTKRPCDRSAFCKETKEGVEAYLTATVSAKYDEVD